jgi:predicted protein tyrosine phosphatase
MFKKIQIMTLLMFNDYCRCKNITDSTVDDLKKSCFISITDNESVSIFNSNHSNVLLLKVLDINKEILDVRRNKILKPMTTEQGLNIIDFIDSNRDRNFIVHCLAGVSRSGAVGQFIQEYLGLDYDEFVKHNPNILPNRYILNLLRDLS